jgi:aspartate-semialdehyde dehydrogenase
VAVVGGDTLLARELRDVLESAGEAPRIHLISAAADHSSALSADEEDMVILAPLSADSLEGCAVAFLAGSPASSRRALKVNPQGGPKLVDLTGALEEHPQARLRGPSAEPAGTPAPSGLQVIAHPAAIALTLLLARLGAYAPLRSVVAHVFEPASERGQRGIEELRKQTVGVLSFQKLDTTVFDTQLAFNLLARYGEEALEPLESIEERIERHTASLLAAWPGLPMPSLRLIQAPVFHGHSLSLWVEFASSPDAAALSDALAAFGIDVRTGEPPSNAQISGHSGLSVGAIQVDRNQPRACWLWVVFDNLRLAAENAVAAVRESL